MTVSERGFLDAASNVRRIAPGQAQRTRSGDGDRLVEVDVLDRLQQLGALADRALERLAPRDQALTTGTLVDHGGAHGGGQVAGALRLAAAVDQPDPAVVAVDDLPAGEIDRVVGRQLLVDQLARLAVAL